MAQASKSEELGGCLVVIVFAIMILFAIFGPKKEEVKLTPQQEREAQLDRQYHWSKTPKYEDFKTFKEIKNLDIDSWNTTILPSNREWDFFFKIGRQKYKDDEIENSDIKVIFYNGYKSYMKMEKGHWDNYYIFKVPKGTRTR